jgi:hypothetical protein
MNFEQNHVNLYNLSDYLPNNIFAHVQNNKIISYYVIGCFILAITTYETNTHTKNTYTSKIIIGICFLAIYIYYSQLIDHTNKTEKIARKNKNLIKLKINKFSPISSDNYLLELLNKSDHIHVKAPIAFSNLLKLIEDFLSIYNVLKSNKNTSQPPINQMQIILINDLRDKLERILKYSQTMIHLMPHNKLYLDDF